MRLHHASLLALCTGTASALPQDPTPPVPEVAPEVVPAESEVACRVDGHEILEADIDEQVALVLAEQTGGRGLPPEQLAAARAQLRPQILEFLIANRLLDDAVERGGFEVSDEEALRFVETGIDSYLVFNELSPEDFAERLRVEEGLTVDEFLAERANDPEFRRYLRHRKLVEARLPEETAVSPEEVEASYEEQRSAFERPERVRASHILIETQELEGPEALEAARAEAAALVTAARAPEADFAALAREHSQGPSAALGGDLGYFPREGAVAEPFAAAAFALEVGEVSDVVETPFGLHVIQVTGRREADVIPFEDAREALRRDLRNERFLAARDQHVATLREAAEVSCL